MKVQGGKGKQILRKALFARAPQSLFDRPKAGFAVPVGSVDQGTRYATGRKNCCPSAGSPPKAGSTRRIVRARWADHLSRPPRFDRGDLVDPDVPGLARRAERLGKALHQPRQRLLRGSGRGASGVTVT